MSIRERINWNSLFRLFFDNPFYIKRMRSNLRAGRFYITLSSYILVTCVLLSGSLMVGWSSMTYTGSSFQDLGRQVFISGMVIQAIFLCFLVPLLSTNALVLEKEKQTFEMIKMTTLPPTALITGELLALGLSTGILIVSSLPVIGLILLVGGVSPSEIGVLYITLFLTTLILGSYGLLNATMQNKAYRAQAGTIMGMILFGILFSFLFYNKSTALLACMNPLVLFNALSRTPPMISFFNWSIPMLPTVIILSLSATLLFIIIASRKAYDIDKPALSTWQMTALYYGLLFLLVSGSWQYPKEGYFHSLLAIFAFLLIFLMNQIKEIHLHKRDKPCQVFQTCSLPVFWLHLIISLTVLFFWNVIKGMDLGTPAFHLSNLVVFVSLTTYWAMIQMISRLSSSRELAIRNALILTFTLFIIPLLVGGIALQFGYGSDEVAHASFWRGWVASNPLVALLELQSRMENLFPYQAWEEYRDFYSPWVICCAVHLVLLAGIQFLSLVLKPGRKTRMMTMQEATLPAGQP